MLKVYKYLSHTKTTSNVMFKVTFNGMDVRISSGVSVNRANFKNGKILKKESDYELKVSTLDLLESKIKKYGYDLLSNPEISRELLKTKLIKLIKGAKFNDSLEFFDIFQKFIETRETGFELAHTGNKFSPDTIRHYKVVYKMLYELKPNLTFNDISNELIKKIEVFQINKGFAKNTIGKNLRTLKVFLNYCLKNGFIESMPFFKTYSENVTNVVLSMNEIKKLLEYNYESSKFNIIRDLFVLQCFLGLRVSDFFNLTSQNIDLESKVIRVNVQKTKKAEFLVIPLHPIAIEILKKYQLIEIVFPSTQYYNRALKDICKIAGIDQPVSIAQTRGGVVVTETIPKYELIASHTARRTFITIAIASKIQTEVIMKITGHLDYRSFKKYQNLSEDDLKKGVINFGT